jgi:ribonuclease HI
MHKRLFIYSDGGARGNPGPAAAAFLILTEENEILRKNSLCIGNRTNNQSEYEALIVALEAAAKLGSEEVICHLDSELVAKHLTGEYHVKNIALQNLWKRVQELKRCFRHVEFVNVPRENPFIQKADRLVNEALDKSLT